MSLLTYIKNSQTLYNRPNIFIWSYDTKSIEDCNKPETLEEILRISENDLPITSPQKNGFLTKIKEFFFYKYYKNYYNDLSYKNTNILKTVLSKLSQNDNFFDIYKHISAEICKYTGWKNNEFETKITHWPFDIDYDFITLKDFNIELFLNKEDINRNFAFDIEKVFEKLVKINKYIKNDANYSYSSYLWFIFSFLNEKMIEYSLSRLIAVQKAIEENQDHESSSCKSYSDPCYDSFIIIFARTINFLFLIYYKQISSCWFIDDMSHINAKRQNSVLIFSNLNIRSKISESLKIFDKIPFYQKKIKIKATLKRKILKFLSEHFNINEFTIFGISPWEDRVFKFK